MSGPPLILPPLIVMTDPARLDDPLPLLDHLPVGAAILLRHYTAADRPARAVRLRAETRRRGLLLLIGADWRLAWRVGADGVHLPENLAARIGAMRRRPGWIVTAAAHSQAALVAAARAGAHAALLSPVFPTASHPEARTLGPVRFGALARTSPLPVYALGGIGRRNVTRLIHSGAVGLAGISGVATCAGIIRAGAVRGSGSTG